MTERERIERRGSPERDPTDERLRSLLKATYRVDEPTAALEQRVAELTARHTVQGGPSRVWWRPLFPRRVVFASALAASALAILFGTALSHWENGRSGRSDTARSVRAPSALRPTPWPQSGPQSPRDRGRIVAGRRGILPGVNAITAPLSPVGSGSTKQIGQALPSPALSRVQPDDGHSQPQIASMDDLLFVNQAPEAVVQRWTTMPQAEWERIEALLRRTVRVKDDFVRIPFPRIAATSGRPIAQAVESYKREAAVVDPRLSRQVTLQAKGTALSDLCDDLRAQTGVQLTAGRSVADEKVTIFCEKLPLRQIMRAINHLFGFTWLRSGKEGEYRYELEQDLKSQLLEEELRNRDTNAALLALDHGMEAYRPYLDLTFDQLQARCEQATGPERERLQPIVQGGGWIGIQLYSRLTPADRTALASGQPLLFSLEAAHPDRRLPAEWVQPILRSRIYLAPPPEKSVPVAELPGITLSSVGLELDRSDLGQAVLGVRVNAARSSEGSSVSFWTRLADGRGTAMAEPDNATANEAVRSEAPFRQQVSVRPECSCSRLHGEKPQPGEPPVPFVFSSDVWEALYRETGQGIVADFYTRLYPVAGVTVERKPLFDALCQVGDAMGVRWRKEGELLLCRSTSFFWDRLQEVPNRYLKRWQQEKRDRGGLPLESLIEMASLTDDQLNSNPWGGRAIMDCWGLNEWQIVGGVRAAWRHAALRHRDAPGGISPYPPHLELRSYSEQSPWLTRYDIYPGDLRTEVRFLGTLTQEQRHHALQEDGLAVAGLSPDQQRRLLQLWDQEQAKYEQQGHRLDVNPQQLLAGRFSFEYIPAGQYYWSPPWTQPAPRPRVLPHVAGRTAEEALAAARRIYPDAIPEQIKRCEDGELAPSISVGPVPLQASR